MRGGRSTSNLLMGTCGQCGAYTLCSVQTVLAGNRRVETWRCAASSKCRQRQEEARKVAEVSPEAACRERQAAVRSAQEGLQASLRAVRVRDARAREAERVEVFRFELACMGFKEAVLAALNKTRFIAGGSRERVYHWERKD